MTLTDVQSKVACLLRTELLLQYPWTFWIEANNPGITGENYEANLGTLYTIGTVQDFWRAYNNINGPEKLLNRHSLHFMKKSIKPLWEDPGNENGGSLSLRIDKIDSPKVWLELLMMLIGEQLSDVLADDDAICGLSISSRWNMDLVQLWNARADRFNQAAVLERIQLVLPNVEFQTPYYKAHKARNDFHKK